MNQILPANRVALITLGSPRAVNYDFAKWIDAQGLFMNTRIEYDNDMVVTLPAQCNGAYWHRGKLTQLTIQCDGRQNREVATACGDVNGIARTIGGVASEAIGLVTNRIDTSVTHSITSSVGVLLDIGLSIGSFIARCRLPVVGAYRDHVYGYWNYEPYGGIVRS